MFHFPSKTCALFLSAVVSLLHAERIVTDPAQLAGGAPIDFSYNDTVSDGDPPRTPSSPGCPKGEAEFPWVYFSAPLGVNCYRTGLRGPCAEGQLLLIEEKGNLFGHCNCDCFQSKKEGGYSDLSEPFCRAALEYAYHADVRTCFALYSQGPCKRDEWLIKSENPTAASPTTCEKTSCEKNEIPVLDDFGDFESCGVPMATERPPPQSGVGGIRRNGASTASPPKFAG